MQLTDIAQSLGVEVHGDDGREFRGMAPLEQAEADQIGFVTSEKYLAAALASRAGALILPLKLADKADRPALLTSNPLATFARVTALFAPACPPLPGIHPSAIIHSSARLGENCEIGPHVVIGAKSDIGARSIISAGTVVAENCTIGEDSRIYSQVSIYARTQIGARCILHSGCVLGSDGFGNALENGRWIKIPQIGRVIIGDDCEIGANTCIDRGALEDTVIGHGVKLDNLIHIAHNCQVGDDTAMAACVGIAGSTKIGKRCQIGGAAMIVGHIEIGDDVMVSGATFIGKSLPKPGAYTSVMPQQPHADWVKNIAHLRHLHDMHDRIRNLEKALAKINKPSEES